MNASASLNCFVCWCFFALLCRYVKAYLLPDPTKTSKRKTKAARQSVNPKFGHILKVGEHCFSSFFFFFDFFLERERVKGGTEMQKRLHFELVPFLLGGGS